MIKSKANVKSKAVYRNGKLVDLYEEKKNGNITVSENFILGVKYVDVYDNGKLMKQTEINTELNKIIKITRNEYNEHGFLLRSYENDILMLEYTLDDKNRIIKKVEYTFLDETDTVHFIYDDNGRLICTISNDSEFYITQYDNKGRVISQHNNNTKYRTIYNDRKNTIETYADDKLMSMQILNKFGNTIEMIEVGKRTVYKYDRKRRIKTRYTYTDNVMIDYSEYTYYDNHYVIVTYNPEGAIISNSVFDNNDRLLNNQYTTDIDILKSYHYDYSNMVGVFSRLKYDHDNIVLHEIGTKSDSGDEIITCKYIYEYNKNGDTIKIQNNYNVTEIEYEYYDKE